MRKIKEIVELVGPHELVAVTVFVAVVLVWAAILPDFLSCGCPVSG